MTSTDAGQPGIEIHVSNTGSVEAIGKALHALHLDSLGKFMARNTVAIIVVDGQEIRQPLFVKHFVPCAVGVHKVGFFFHNGTTFTPQEWQGYLNEATLQVTVEPGKVALLDYKMRSPTVMTAELSLTGMRDA